MNHQPISDEKRTRGELTYDWHDAHGIIRQSKSTGKGFTPPWRQRSSRLVPVVPLWTTQAGERGMPRMGKETHYLLLPSTHFNSSNLQLEENLRY